MAGITIQNIISELEFGGARPSLFEVNIFPPGLVGTETMVPKLTYMCRAANLPEANNGVIEVPYQGRKIKVCGNRTFPEWTITVMNDEDFLVRRAFEAWEQALNAHRENIRTGGATSAPLSYKGSATVTQISKEGKNLRKYNFVGVWPSNVSAIDLDWGTTDAIEEFRVTLQYDMWELGTVIAG